MSALTQTVALRPRARLSAPPAIKVEDVALAYRLARNRAPSLQEHVFSLLKRQVSYERL